MSSKPLAIMTFAFSEEWYHMQLRETEEWLHYKKIREKQERGSINIAHQAPRGIFAGPLEDIRSKLIQLVTVLIKLNLNVSA